MQQLTTTMNELKKNGERVIGCFPLYPPLELFHSLSITPILLWELKEWINHTADSDRHLQTYTCSVARCLMQAILADDAPLFDALYMYNACDTLRNLPELIDSELEEKGRTVPIFKLHIPAVPAWQTDGRGYLKSRIQALISELESHFKVSFSSEAFKESTTRYHEMRLLYKEAEDFVAKGSISFSDFVKIGCSGYHLSLEYHIEELKRLISTQSDNPDTDGSRVMLSGIISPPTALIDAMEGAGLRVVCNDLASLSRSYQYNPEPSDDPVAYYLDFYENHTPCTTLLPSSDDRVHYMLELAQKNEIDGVIFIGEKFCEHEYFEFPYLTKQFKEKGIKTLQIEFSLDDKENIGPLTTRIEAFAELIHQ